MQISLPLLIVRPSILNLVKHFFTQPYTGEMKCPTNIPLSCAFYFISMLVMLHKHPTSIFIKWWTMIIHRCSQPHYLWPLPIAWSSSIILHQATWSSTQINTWLDLSWMTWSTSCHHVALLVHRSQLHLFFIVALVHWRQVLAQASRPRAVYRSKSFDLPFTLATQSILAKPCLLIFST